MFQSDDSEPMGVNRNFSHSFFMNEPGILPEKKARINRDIDASSSRLVSAGIPGLEAGPIRAWVEDNLSPCFSEEFLLFLSILCAVGRKMHSPKQ